MAPRHESTISAALVPVAYRSLDSFESFRRGPRTFIFRDETGNATGNQRRTKERDRVFWAPKGMAASRVPLYAFG